MERCPASDQVEDFLLRLRSEVFQSDPFRDQALREPLVGGFGEGREPQTDRSSPLRRGLDMEAAKGSAFSEGFHARVLPADAEQMARARMVEESERAVAAQTQSPFSRATESALGSNPELKFGGDLQADKRYKPWLQRSSVDQLMTPSQAFQNLEHADTLGGSQPTEVFDSQEEAPDHRGSFPGFMSPDPLRFRQPVMQAQSVRVESRGNPSNQPELSPCSDIPHQVWSPFSESSARHSRVLPGSFNQNVYNGQPATFSLPRQLQFSTEPSGASFRLEDLEALEREASQSQRERMLLNRRLEIRASILRSQLNEAEQEMHRNDLQLELANRQVQEVRDMRRQFDLNRMHFQPFNRAPSSAFNHEANRDRLPDKNRSLETQETRALSQGSFPGVSYPIFSEIHSQEALKQEGSAVSEGKQGLATGEIKLFASQRKVSQEDLRREGKDADKKEDTGEDFVKRATKKNVEEGKVTRPEPLLSNLDQKEVLKPEGQREKETEAGRTTAASEVEKVVKTAEISEIPKQNRVENEGKTPNSGGSEVVRSEVEREEKEAKQGTEKGEPKQAVVEVRRHISVQGMRELRSSRGERRETGQGEERSERKLAASLVGTGDHQQQERSALKGDKEREKQDSGEKDKGTPERHRSQSGGTISEERTPWREKRKASPAAMESAPVDKLKGSEADQVLQLKRRRWEKPRREPEHGSR